jgi:hypothetical protein
MAYKALPRWLVLDQHLRQLQQQIWASSGTWLDGSQRLAVAREVQTVAADCEACRSLTDLCIKPGKEGLFFGHTMPRAHALATTASPLPAEIRMAVHAIVWFQNRLTKDWCQRVVDHMRAYAAGKPLQEADAAGAFAELVYVVAVSFGTQQFYRTLGELCPPLASDPSPSSTPSCRSVSTFSSRVFTDHTNWLPSVVFANLRPKWLPAACQEMKPAVWATMPPWRALTLIPTELVDFYAYGVVTYCAHPSADAGEPPEWKACPRGLRRPEVEVVATEVAASHSCAF